MDKTIVMLLGFSPNPRMEKRIAVEKQIGAFHLIFWDRGDTVPWQPPEGVCSVQGIRTAAAEDPVKRIRPYLSFAGQVRRLLKTLQPDLIHVQGLDMLHIADWYRKSAGKKVVLLYEVADLHRLLVDRQSHPLKKLLQKYLRWEDRRLGASCDLLILTSMRFYEVYFQSFLEPDKVLYMPNVPDLSAFRAYRKKPEGTGFTVGFIGSVRYKQQMRNLIEAARRCRMKLLIAGYEKKPVEIEPLCRGDSDIRWVGRFDFARQAAGLYGSCDLIYCVYDADMSNVQVALPNKLYEAVFCEIPLVVAEGTYLGQLVKDWGVGVCVDHRSADALAVVLEGLRRDRERMQRMRENCRRRKDQIHPETCNQALRERIEKLLGEEGAAGEGG